MINHTNSDTNMYAVCSIEEHDYKPRKSTINNILGYSKALSVRKSSYIDDMRMMLN